MTIEQIQAAIDAKADARQIINMIADYIQANPGGGGVTLYSGDGILAGDRVVNLNEHSLRFGETEYDELVLNSVDESGLTNLIQSVANINDGNYSQVITSSSDTGVTTTLQSRFNADVKVAKIIALANSTEGTLNYIADTHTFNGVSEFADNAAAVTGGLAVGTIYRTGDLMKIVHA